jgi:hypothetical protein
MDQRHHIKAARAEIAARYRREKAAKKRDRLPANLACFRVRDLNGLFARRYGHTLPDDDAARADVLIMAHHLAGAALAGDPEVKIRRWLGLRAPWLAASEVAKIIGAVISSRKLWTADELAAELRLTATERADLSITTIGAIDMTKRQRRHFRKARKAFKEAQRRRALGAKPRAEYEAHSIALRPDP